MNNIIEINSLTIINELIETSNLIGLGPFEIEAPEEPAEYAYFTYTGTYVGLGIALPAEKSIIVHWGDDTTTQIDGPQTYYYAERTYSVSDTYEVRITGDINSITLLEFGWDTNITGDIQYVVQYLIALTSLGIISSSISGSISSITTLPSLTYVDLEDSPISGNLSDLVSMTALTTLSLGYSPISGNINSLSTLTALTNLNLSNNTSISGDIRSLSTLTSLNNLNLISSSINTYTQGTLPSEWDNISTLFIRNINLSQQEVDDFLCDLNMASTSSSGTLWIDGNNAAPSATGLACKDTLVAKGWAVDVSS